MSFEILQHRYWNGEPRRLQDLFRLTKSVNDRTVETTCEGWSHQLGSELRLVVVGDLLQSRVCRSGDELLDAIDHWKGAMLEKGWQ